MKTKYLFLLIFISLSIGACKKLDKDFDALLNNPNLPSTSSADVDLYLNSVQLSFPSFFYDISNNGSELTRMEFFAGPTYPTGISPVNFDGVWTTAYASILKNVDALVPLALQQKKFMHAGIARILKAYTLITLVDVFGDVPYTQAVKGTVELNPSVDKGRVVYDSSIALLQQAKIELAQAAPKPTNDLYYSGDAKKWIAVANSILLKAYIQTRLVDASAKTKIDALIAENKLINSSDQDFTFKFGNQSQAPDSRHPKYANNYTNGGANDYLGNYFLYSLFSEKGSIDPRTRYYFYRQTTDIAAALPNPVDLQFTVPCRNRPFPSTYPVGTPFCMVSAGYFGRDHGNNEGTPPDNQYRTTWGVYPAGGEFDTLTTTVVKQTSPGMGGKGQGIHPIWMSFFTDFVKAEAALTLGVAGDPKAFLLSALDKSFATVRDFPGKIGVTVPDNFAITKAQIDAYKSFVSKAYDGAATTDAKLEIIMKEYYISLWGNGIESYNNYRRTGKPANIQPIIQNNPGPYIRSFYYPSVYVNLNKNAVQKASTSVQVFWDVNPANFLH